jgi:predicted nucleic acid-binding protein
MRKKKKNAKVTASNATKRGLANKSAAPAIDSPVPTGSNEKAVTASDAISQSPLPTEAEKVAAPAPDVPSTSQQPAALRQVDAMFGQIVKILMRSPQHKQRSLADLEWLVLPAVLSGQFSLAQAQQQSGIPGSVGVAALEQRFTLLVSVPLLIEYQAVMTRAEHLAASKLSAGDVSVLLDAVASVGAPVRLAFLWRPTLRDPDDDMVLEAAVNGQADAIVTFNRRDFRPATE